MSGVQDSKESNNEPLSSISSDAGVSSSFILFPSYKNLEDGQSTLKHGAAGPRQVECNVTSDESHRRSMPLLVIQDSGGRTADKITEKRTTHRILLTSLPTFAAYAPCSLLSFVFRLILKNTSSPVCVVTCIVATIYNCR